MKRITAATLFTLASILVTGNAFSQNHEARVSVPFNFTVGNETLPAGNYSIAPVSDTVIQIRNTDTHTALLTQAAQDSNRSWNGGELVFDKAAGQYFLREILCESIAMNAKLPSTKQEEKAFIEEAQRRGDNRRVLVAVK